MLRTLFSRFLAIGLLAIVAACATNSNQGNVPIPDGAKMTHRAVLIGKSNHDTVGTISLYQSDEPIVIVFEPNFSIDPSATTVLALGKDGYRADTIFATLHRHRGRQSYAVPKKLRLNGYNEIWLWSVSSNAPIGLARLTPI